jgi:hypothetical protein
MASINDMGRTDVASYGNEENGRKENDGEFSWTVNESRVSFLLLIVSSFCSFARLVLVLRVTVLGKEAGDVALIQDDPLGIMFH